MKKFSTLSVFPVGAVKPSGILRAFLEKQMDGLTGHIAEAGFPFESPKWGEEFFSDNRNPQWWVYEQNAYWLDGYVRCAILLEDGRALRRAAEIIGRVLDHPDADGYLGAKFMKKVKGENRWPHVVFFRACMALYDATKDEKIVRAIARHYLGCRADHSKKRNVLNVEIMLWAYEKTGDERLLSMAEQTYQKYNRTCKSDVCDRVARSGKKPFAHGVTYNEYAKLGAILYSYTGKEEYLSASRQAYEKLETMFMLPGGCHCSNEYLYDNDYMQSYETCDISDYTWSLGYLLAATGSAVYADRIERCVFNAGVGSVLENFRGLQYFSCANQTIADHSSNHNDFSCGSKWMSYRPNPGTECCPGNVNRFMPNYMIRQYFTDEAGNVYSALFGDGTLEYGGIKIEQKTNYPFETSGTYSVATQRPFCLYVRIPSWATGGEILVDGRPYRPQVKNGFYKIDIAKSCTVGYSFSAAIERHLVEGGVWFSRGPLVYSLGIKTRRETDEREERSSKAFPAYNMYAASEWRYGIKEGETASFFGGAAGWTLADDLPHIVVRGYRVRGWDYERKSKVVSRYPLTKRFFYCKKIRGNFVFTPRNPKNAVPEGVRRRYIYIRTASVNCG